MMKSWRQLAGSPPQTIAGPLDQSNPGQLPPDKDTSTTDVQMTSAHEPGDDSAGQHAVSPIAADEPPASLATSNDQPATSLGSSEAATIPSFKQTTTAGPDPTPRSPTVAETPEVEESLFHRVYPRTQHPLRYPQILRDNIEKAINMSYLTLEDNYDPEYVELHHWEPLADRLLSASSKSFPIH